MLNWLFNFFKKKKKKNLIWLNIYYNQYEGVIGHIHSSNFSSRIYSGYENVKARDKAY